MFFYKPKKEHSLKKWGNCRISIRIELAEFRSFDIFSFRAKSAIYEVFRTEF